jgi:hypothetical protein
VRHCILALSIAASAPFAASGAATAQQVIVPASTSHEAVTATIRGLTLPAGEFSVVEVVEAVASYLCRNYLYDAEELAKVSGFRLQRDLALDAVGSEETLLTLLAARDLVALPLDEHRGLYQIVARGTAQRAMPIAPVPWRSADEILRRPRLRDFVMTAIQVEFADANVLANAMRSHFALQGMWQPGMTCATAAGPKTLLLHGYRDQLAMTILVVQQIDRLSAPPPVANSPALERLEALEREVAELRAELQRRQGR